MGCCALNNPDESLFDALPHELKRCEVESFDKVMDDCEKTIVVIESARKTFCASYGNLVVSSGAVVIKNAKFSNVLDGLLYLMARDIGFEIGKVLDFTASKPFVAFKGEQALSESLKTCKHDIENFIEHGEEMLAEFTEVKNKIEELIKVVTDNFNNFMEDFNKKIDGDFMKLKPLVDIANTNKKVITRGSQILTEMINIIASIATGVNELIKKLKEEKDLKTLLELLKKIMDENKKDKKTYEDERFLHWTFSTDAQKFKTFDEFKPVYHKITGKEYPSNGKAEKLATTKVDIKKPTDKKPEDIKTNDKKPAELKKVDVKKTEEHSVKIDNDNNLLELLRIKHNEVKANLAHELNRVEEEMKEHFAHLNADNLRLHQESKGEKPTLGNQLQEIQKKVTDLEKKVGEVS